MTLPQSREPTRKKNVASPSVPCVPLGDKADAYAASGGTHRGDASREECVPRFVRAEQQRREQRARALGLVARFSREFGYIALHNPNDGEWVEIPFKEAPSWARTEAFSRRELRKAGKAHDLTAREMEELWASEQSEMWEEPAPRPGRKVGLIYDDERLEEEQ